MNNSYNPRTGKIDLAPDASLYACFHELAHKEQHEKLAFCYVFWCAFRRLRGIGRLVTIWIEVDAYRRARVRLQRLGHWTDEAEKEARRMLMSYIRSKQETA